MLSPHILLPCRVTKLPVSLHVHVMRQIKLARTMGLIAGEARLDKLHVRKLREVELRKSQEEKARAAASEALQIQQMQQKLQLQQRA